MVKGKFVKGNRLKTKFSIALYNLNDDAIKKILTIKKEPEFSRLRSCACL